MIPASRWLLRGDTGPKVIPHRAARPRPLSDARYQSGDGPVRRSVTAAVLDKLRTGGELCVVQGGVRRPWSRGGR